MQFYFLSILFNAVSGYLLVNDTDQESGAAEGDIRLLMRNETFRLILGILTMLMGLLKLLSSTDLPVIGDLIPAVVGLVSGFILIFEYYRRHSTLEPEESEKLTVTLVKNRRWIGFIAIASAALHFLFPSVLLL
ncbi:hypothetical protein FACS189493_7240 [Spirochaetia bacterium]|nr:hypothetical protein FACS189493_7240 [Spirochaetia bacterium]